MTPLTRYLISLVLLVLNAGGAVFGLMMGAYIIMALNFFAATVVLRGLVLNEILKAP